MFSPKRRSPAACVLEGLDMQKPVEIDLDLYARAAAAAAREGRDVEVYINELIRLQIREVERMHEIVRTLEEIATAMEGDASGNDPER